VLGFETFEAYCKKRWDYTKTYADYLVSATSVMDNITAVTTMVVKPSTERQACAIARLTADQQLIAWQKAIKTAPEGKATAADRSTWGIVGSHDQVNHKRGSA